MSNSAILEELTWVEAEALLTEDAVIVIALGAACKEHGKHLKLKNDLVIAEYLKTEVLKNTQVIVAPTINYSFYPAFVEYPGSISLGLETAKNMISDICRSLTQFGPRRFYVINTGVSTLTPLSKASAELKAENILLHYTNLDKAMSQATEELEEQEGGSHADEIETSMMLYIDSHLVNMDVAVKDYDRQATGPLSRQPKNGFSYSPSGVWGDPTLATQKKGEAIVKCLITNIIRDIDELRKQDLP